MVVKANGLGLLLILALSWSTQAAAELTWQEAVLRLAQERTQAETCVGLLKSFGDEVAIKRGAITYDEAKADYDGVITGLVLALARKAQSASLPDLQAQLQRGFEKRTAFCQSVKPMALKRTGEKDIIDHIATGLAKPVIDALPAIWQRTGDDDALMRQVIQSQLEATLWPAFDVVS